MSEKSVHKLTLPHGKSTPHKFPFEVENELDIINSLSTQLYPTGRAWFKKEGGVFDSFHAAINTSFVRVLADSQQLIDGNLPDNENFTEEDASLWEYRLGLPVNKSIDLELRKASVKRKLGHPNNVKARQHSTFIEAQLQLVGFDVYVHENTFPYKLPSELANLQLKEVQHGGGTQHGAGTQHGGDSFDIIANSIDEVESYAIGEESLWATFFIGGKELGSTANVDKNRLREFKELIIKLKPAHLVVFTFVNYI